jgi:hypothetical protein
VPTLCVARRSNWGPKLCLLVIAGLADAVLGR